MSALPFDAERQTPVGIMRCVLSSMVVVCFATPDAFAQRHQSGGGVHSFSGPAVVPSHSQAPPRFNPPANGARQNAALFQTVLLGRMNRFTHLGNFRTFGGFGDFYGYPYYSFNDEADQHPIPFDDSVYDPVSYSPPRSIVPLPPLPNDHPTTALLALQVPSGAEVWLQGKKVNAGVAGTFESPDLKTNETFAFELRVIWLEKGKRIEEKRTLTMRAGDHQSLQYLALPDKAAPVER